MGKKPLNHTYKEHCPKLPNDNLTFRARTVSNALKNDRLQQALWKMSEQSFLFWLNAFVWTYDAKGDKYQELGYDSPHMPFISFDYQDDHAVELQEAIEKGHNLAIEKSRDMGESWLIIAMFTWFWLFQGAGNDFLLGSRKQQYVDELGNMSALMPKARYILKRLPSWMLPKGFSLGNQSEWDNYNRLINPVSGCVISGEANNVNFGTAGRYKAVLFDELAKWEHTDSSAWESASDTTSCKIAVSSAWGERGIFFELIHQKAGAIKTIRLLWKLHPLKDQAWYDEQKRTRSKADVASNIDIDYATSVEGRAFPDFDINVQGLEEDPYDQGRPIQMDCDFNIRPMSWSLSHEIKDDDFYFAEVVDDERTTTAAHMNEFLERYSSHKNKVIYLYGDFSGSFGSTKGYESDYDIIKRMGRDLNWEVIDMTNQSNPSHRLSLEISAMRLSDWSMGGQTHCFFWKEGTPRLCMSMNQTRRKGDGILKDGAEHSSDGFRYGQVTRHGDEILEQSYGSVSRY